MTKAELDKINATWASPAFKQDAQECLIATMVGVLVGVGLHNAALGVVAFFVWLRVLARFSEAEY